MNNTELIRPEEVDLSNCDREAIHTPGFIQAHGVLLVLQEPDFTIVQVSNNSEEFLGIAVRDLIGKQLNILFSQRQIEQFKILLSGVEKINFCSPVLLKKVKQKINTFNCYFHRKEEVVILELEPLGLESLEIKPDSLNEFYLLLKQSLTKIKKASNFQEITELIVKEIRQITKYDRVMIYQFEPDGTGIIIAEDKDEKITDSYLGLHYPASDIPQQARRLFYESWLRLVVDFQYQPVDIIPRNHPLTDSPTDLSFSFLRSVSPIHVEYAKNMGFRASLAISLIDNKKLWGLVVCHHYSPKNIEYKIRNYCELMGQFISLELVHYQTREAESYQEKIQVIQNKIKQSLDLRKNSIEDIFKKSSLDILELVNAQGAAIYFDNKITLLGETPNLEAVENLISWFFKSQQKEIFFTNSLSQIYPPAQQFKAQASGLLAISVFLKETSYHIFWFRQEVIHTVNWGGNPHKPVIVTNEGTLRLSPRGSFELWKETVKEKSLPWQQVEINASEQLRNTLLLAALNFSQTALEEAAKQAEIANQAKSEFLSRVSHELRTPLNSILGYSQLMSRDSSLSSQQKEYTEIINRNGEHLLILINDVLEMSKIEAGEQKLNENIFDLFLLLNSIEKTFYLKASIKKIQLMFKIYPNVPQFIIADESKLRQVLFNLIDNAIKFTKIGQVIVGVTYQTVHGKILFQVSDTGPGMIDSELEVLFRPFVQTQAGLKSMQGAGLGLTISQKFVNLMGGELTVDSRINSGSTFSFDIAVHLADKSQISANFSNKQVIGLAENQPNYRILIVEDVEDNRRLLLEILTTIGFEVKTAENGREGITLWQQWQPHLILMDILMPVMNGLETTQEIKATPQGQKTVIIAITAHAFSDNKMETLKNVCDDFITKPFREQILFKKIAQHLGVQYRYAEETTTQETPEIVQSNPIKPDDLQVMSAEWVAQLNQAAMELDDIKIIELIEQIPQTYLTLSENLRTLVEDFRWDIIFDLTTAATLMQNSVSELDKNG